MDASLERFLSAEAASIEVPGDEEIVVDPGEQRFGSHAHKLEVRSFEDLQVLHLIPQGINERSVREAIAKDDEVAFDSARRSLERGTDPCDCTAEQDPDVPPKLKLGADLRGIYVGLRKSQHPHTAKLVSETTGTPVAWDSPVAKSVYGWVSQLAWKQIDLVALLFKDIEIGKNSTLTLTPTTKVLWASDIRIHLGGKLKVTSSYIKIKCATVQGNLP